MEHVHFELLSLLLKFFTMREHECNTNNFYIKLTVHNVQGKLIENFSNVSGKLLMGRKHLHYNN